MKNKKKINVFEPYSPFTHSAVESLHFLQAFERFRSRRYQRQRITDFNFVLRKKQAAAGAQFVFY